MGEWVEMGGLNTEISHREVKVINESYLSPRDAGFYVVFGAGVLPGPRVG